MLVGAGAKRGGKVWINPDHVQLVREDSDGDGSVVVMATTSVYVEESTDEVAAKLMIVMRARVIAMRARA
jgi:uncharacterized protein YlzI (FlbEa/FlbD family)